MVSNSPRRSRRQVIGAALAASALLASLAACGSDAGADEGAKSGGLPAAINIVSINPTTGNVAFVGESANKGYRLAVKEINESGLLGSSKINLTFKDTKGEVQNAASEMTSAIASKDISAVFGSVLSNEALAMSPLAEKQKMPVVYTQAGSHGVITGDYTWRATPMMSAYYPLVSKFIKDNNFKSVGLIYTTALPTLQEIGEKTYPELGKTLGFDITKSIGVPATIQDFKAPIQQVLGTKPDVVAALVVGAQAPTVMTQLRQAGYDGPVIGNSGSSGGSLKPAGADGAGMLWPTDFHYDQKAETSKKFVESYRAEFNGENPLNYAAEAYDAAWFLARSIAAAGSVDRTAIKDGMVKESAKTFDGALGAGLKWEKNDIVVPGVVVEHTTDGEKLLYEGAAAS
jgi:branched-chain amino acid transport system substrate-binding protein